jgi:exosome complex component RRP4
MAITILAPAPPPPIRHEAYSEDDDDEMDLDSEEDVDMDGKAASKKPRMSAKHVITPGELVTDDTQWMRCASFTKL